MDPSPGNQHFLTQGKHIHRTWPIALRYNLRQVQHLSDGLRPARLQPVALFQDEHVARMQRAAQVRLNLLLKHGHTSGRLHEESDAHGRYNGTEEFVATT